MKEFKYNGYKYIVYVRPWKKGNRKYEFIKHKIGFRNMWERISLDEYKKAKAKATL